MSSTEPSDNDPLPDPHADIVDPAGPGAAAGADTDDPEIGWGRAIASGLAVLVVGFGGAVFGANRIVTNALALRRTPRELLASGLFFGVIVVLAFVLRRLQARKLI
jgi:hypothetical protein